MCVSASITRCASAASRSGNVACTTGTIVRASSSGQTRSRSARAMAPFSATVRGRSVDQVLDMTVREALTFFSSSPKVLRRLQVLDEIGLGYLRLGQPATTLSGGEAQRIKIAAHLSSHTGDRVLYILDEPTTVLHFDDIAKLLAACKKLIQAGHSLLVIEHNLDVIKTADWIIDLGPEGGEEGGRLVAAGTPEQIAQNESSHTGRYLRDVLAVGRTNAYGGARH